MFTADDVIMSWLLRYILYLSAAALITSGSWCSSRLRWGEGSKLLGRRFKRTSGGESHAHGTLRYLLNRRWWITLLFNYIFLWLGLFLVCLFVFFKIRYFSSCIWYWRNVVCTSFCYKCYYSVLVCRFRIDIGHNGFETRFPAFDQQGNHAIDFPLHPLRPL